MAQEARKRKLDESAEVKQMMAIQSDSFLANSLAKKISDDTHFTELDLRSYYDSNKNEFEEAQGSHILIRFKGSKVPLKPNEKDLTEEEALAKAQDIRKKITDGTDFATLAKAESDDTGSATKGGELGTFKRGQMVPQFDQAAFALPVGQISEPVKTPFGYHLIKITSRTSKPFDEAKAQIEKDLKPKMAKASMEQIFVLLRAVHQLFETDATSVIIAVGDHEKNFLLAVTFLLQIGHRAIDRIAHGRSPARIYTGDPLFHFLNVTGERNIQVRIVVEVDYKHLVLRIRGSYQIERGGLYPLPFFTHAAAVVDNDAERNGNVLPAEDLDGLFNTVFKNLE